MTDKHHCMICDEAFEDYYDAKSHVYTKHSGERCGFAEKCPENYVSTTYDD